MNSLDREGLVLAGRTDLAQDRDFFGDTFAGKSPRVDIDQFDGHDLLIDQTEREELPSDFALIRDMVNDPELNSKPEGQAIVSLAKTAETIMRELLEDGEECPLRADGEFRVWFEDVLAREHPDVSELDRVLFVRELEGFPPIPRIRKHYELAN